jgi:hypothetical protein
VMIQGHEEGVNDNAEGDEKINKWIKNYKREELRQFDIARTAVPHAHDIHTLHTEITYSFFQPEMEEY